MTNTEIEILAAADALVDAFGRHDREAYFAAFSPDATFIFYNLDRPLRNRGEYQAEWALWESRDGFKVGACRSKNRNLQIFGDTAVFTHAVETELTIAGEALSNHERETIVFVRQADGRWLAVHEHLSAMTS